MEFEKPKEIRLPRIYFIVLRKKAQYRIPTSSRFLFNINPEISDILLVKRSYRVKSKVSTDVLQAFIDNWINETVPDITYDNFNEFEQLSQEFDRMKNIIELYRPVLDSLRIKQEIKKRYDTNNYNLQKIIHNYQSNIHSLFKYSNFDPPSFTFINLKNKYAEDNIDDIILQVMKKVEYQDAEYAINEYDKTAIIIKYNSMHSEFYVPAEIECGSENFRVASIQNFQCPEKLSIRFSSQSPITIKKRSLNSYKIRQINVPSTAEIEEGFCTYRSDIEINIIDVKNEPKRILYASGVISEKSNPNIDSFDILLTPGKVVGSLFPERFIKRIASYSFFQNDLSNGFSLRYCNQLQSIGEFSFYQCKMTDVTFPASLTKIETEAFRCTNLRRITFPYGSKLKEIGDFAFGNCNITQLSLPSSLIKLGYGSFCYNDIVSVEFIDNVSNLEIIGGDSFGVTKLKKFKVPKTVTEIGQLAFSDINSLTEFELTSNKLPEIGRDLYFNPMELFLFPSDLIITKKDKKWNKYIFQSKNIKIIKTKTENIKYFKKFIIGKQNDDDDEFSILYYIAKDENEAVIPSFIKIIHENCFCNCKSLKKIQIENKSKLSVIEDFAFIDSSVEELSIPSSICSFENFCFNGADNLIRINVIPSDEKNVIYYNDSILISKSINDEFDTIQFIRRDLRQITIPSFVKRISSSSFNGCMKLNEINFEKNSKLESINENQFANLNICSIEIPKSVNSIGKCAFTNCKNLKFIKLDDDSNLSSIDDCAFIRTSLQCFTIPSSVSYISSTAFSFCNSIKILEIGENSKLKSIDLSILPKSILMVPAELSHKVKL